MKIPKNINQKLKHVPTNNRVYCYDSTILIDFLNRTFMPLPYFVKRESLNDIGPGVPPRMEHMKEPQKFMDHFLSVSDMYDFYLMFRNQTDYTVPVETRWRFGLIIKKLIYSKNGWQFNVRRVGRAQIWYAGPVMLRVKASDEDRLRYKIGTPDVLAGQVEASPDDLRDEPSFEDEVVNNPPEQAQPSTDPTLT